MASDKFLQLHRCAASGDAVRTADVLRHFGRAPDELRSIAAALTTAAASSSAGHTEVIRVLLEDGRADPTPLLAPAVFGGNEARVRLLLTDGHADPATNNSYALRVAAVSAHHTILQLLLEDGRADPSVALDLLLLFCEDPAFRRAAGRIMQNAPAIRAALRWRRRRTWVRAVVAGPGRGDPVQGIAHDAQ
jgi:hypothetical protein